MAGHAKKMSIAAPLAPIREVEVAASPSGVRDIMTAEEVADYLHISRAYVFILIERDNLPHIRLGRRLLFRRDTLDRFLQERETTPARR